MSKITVVSKDIGYELRCADPMPYDMEYTRDLGYCAAKFLFSGGNAAMVSLQAGNFVPIPFAQLLDPQTGRTRVRMVDIQSTRYAIARRYMIRLRRDDFDEPAVLTMFGAVCNPEEVGRGIQARVRLRGGERGTAARPAARARPRGERPQSGERPGDKPGA